MTVQIPWWVKISAKLILSRLPFGYAVWQRLGLFRHGQMDTSEYAIRVFNSHVEKTGLTNQLHDKTILELGPGDSVATAIIAAAHGACTILVDAGAFVREDIAPYLELVEVLTKQGLIPLDLSGCRNIDELLARFGAKYMTAGLTSLTQIESESVDLIFSQAVLEHIRKNEFRETMQEYRRILRPNGICSHQVDLRDHMADALNNLRFSERVWESEFFATSGFYTNRIRYSQMLQLFSDVGFTVEVTDVQRWASLPTTRCKLALEFKYLPDDELNVSVFDVLLR
jgi:SAM-dependent methyltransferase